MPPTIQIFGVKKCQDTNKALRFFKERAIKTQFVDLAEKGVSKGELDSISRKIPHDQLIDKNGKQYKNRNLEYINHDIETELLNDPLLFKTPITRLGQEAAVGVTPDIWKKWIEKNK
jgi:arsenate reductase (glutaredoxin)